MTRVVVTGGPGAGKTTLLQALAARGYAVVDDSARAILRERRLQGLAPRPPAGEFAREILRRDIEHHRRHADATRPVFFERGVVDALYMADAAHVLADGELAASLAAYRYAPVVFVLPPWEAIYVRDAERDQDFAHACRVHGLTLDWYRRCGYRPQEVPPAPVEARCDQVLATLAQRDA